MFKKEDMLVFIFRRLEDKLKKSGLRDCYFKLGDLYHKKLKKTGLFIPRNPTEMDMDKFIEIMNDLRSLYEEAKSHCTCLDDKKGSYPLFSIGDDFDYLEGSLLEINKNNSYYHDCFIR